MKIMWGAAAVLAVLVSACTAVVPASPAPSLEDTSWVVAEINGEPTLPDYQPTMNFGAAGGLNGDNGCNLYAGSYTLSGNSLTITAPAQTMMACTDPDRAAQETAFSAALTTVASVRTAGENVELLTTAGDIALLLSPVPPLELAGTSWVLAGLVEGSSVSAPAPGTTVTLAFEADTLSGKACNSFRAGYTLEGTEITVAPIASTKMMCNDPGVMEQEALVLQLLEGTSSVQLNRGVLVLTDPDGRGLQFGKA